MSTAFSIAGTVAGLFGLLAFLGAQTSAAQIIQRGGNPHDVTMEALLLLLIATVCFASAAIIAALQRLLRLFQGQATVQEKRQVA